jgi:biotin carboxyl carrier protein
MSGTVTKVFQKAGAVLKKGDQILAMEGMKLELVIKAEFNCTLVKMYVHEGQFVQAGQKLFEV